MVKRYDHLYPQVTSFENLYFAFRKAARGKRANPTVASFEFNLESNLIKLQEELIQKSYIPGSYYSFYIHDPKRRLISAAPFRDRVVHHALCNVIEPIFERTFIRDSYANRVGKGTHRAIARAQSFSRIYTYVLQCDVRQFFPSVDHAILNTTLSRKLSDLDVINLCKIILKSGAGLLGHEYDQVYFPGDDLFAAVRQRGLPIGNLTSQFWANVYLNELDQFVKRKLECQAYLRYVDDFLLFFHDKRRLWEWLSEIREFLYKLRLTLHSKTSTVYPVQNGIPYLGFRIYPTHLRLLARNGKAFNRRLSRWLGMVARGNMNYEELERRVQGWIAHARHGDTWGLRRALLTQPVPKVGDSL